MIYCEKYTILCSFYLHCDPTESHYLKLILDSIFCSRNGSFLSEIIWKRSIHVLSRKYFNITNDIIFLYCKSKNHKFNPQFESINTEELKKSFPYLEKETGRYYSSYGLEIYSNNYNKHETRILDGKEINTLIGWKWAQKSLDEKIAKNPYLIYWTKNGRPRYKIYADEYKGKKIGNIWDDIPSLSSTSKERLGYPTQKPEALLERIIKASSNEGDLILDAYCGCGTTVTVAQRLNRRWIGIDITYQSIALIMKRLEDNYPSSVTENTEQLGIPKDYASAKALAEKKNDRTRKEFEKWAILTYSKNRAIINEKKGSDKGIDGLSYIFSENNKREKIIFQVKSGKVNSSHIRDLRGTIEREVAAIGIFITLENPTKDMESEAISAGFYENINIYTRKINRIKIVTIKQILKGAHLDVPTVVNILK
ncbi:MAG: restriction endonuclease [Candidatus Paraimprobicoccus trichonymphae]|uniref:Methyltransferase n=1 Tax=Candidatus Paraimprobicoccus trichonymphae TaxID=3033793 RepID=A0AA48I9H6_9FIRM|nr:MAG: restriction endonuclease [Candidatus Paraimprobicoccus trichonymphae]